MPTSGRAPQLLVDTGVAIALLVEDHQFHQSTMQAIGARRLGLAGHAAFEAFSVLTRLPAPTRRTQSAVVDAMASNFPASCFLSAAGALDLFDKLAGMGIGGGAVYDTRSWALLPSSTASLSPPATGARCLPIGRSTCRSSCCGRIDERAASAPRRARRGRRR